MNGNTKGQNQRTIGYSRNGNKTNRNPFDFTNKNNSSSQNTSLNNSNRNKKQNSRLKIAEITADNAAKAYTTTTRTTTQMVNTTKMAATTDKTELPLRTSMSRAKNIYNSASAVTSSNFIQQHKNSTDQISLLRQL